MEKKTWTPMELEEELKKSMIGQDGYIHDLAICIWVHNQRRLHYMETGEIISKPKYNMLVLGKSGMGKTSAIQSAAELLDIPVIIEDASELRGEGWRGKHVSDIIRDVIDVEKKAEEKDKRGAIFSIVVLDEIDKVFSEDVLDKTFSPVSNLLKFIEGMKASYSEGNNTYSMQTDNLLFICAGAFEGLSEIIKKRLSPKVIGFKTSDRYSPSLEEDVLKEVTPDDLISYGMSEQLLGRLSKISVLNELTKNDYKKILLESEASPIRQLNNLFIKKQGIRISVTDSAAEELAERICNSKMGARALQSEITRLMDDTLYHIPYEQENNEYQLDFKCADFCVHATKGRREPLKSAESKDMFMLSDLEYKRIKEVPMGIERKDSNSIQCFAMDMFEDYADGYFENGTGRGFTDIYDYKEIHQAQLFTAAAIAQLLLESVRSGREKTMFELLEVVKQMKIEDSNNSIHPLNEIRMRFLKIAAVESDTKLQEIRLFAWTIVRNFALDMHITEYAAEEVLPWDGE